MKVTKALEKDKRQSYYATTAPFGQATPVKQRSLSKNKEVLSSYKATTKKSDAKRKSSEEMQFDLNKVLPEALRKPLKKPIKQHKLSGTVSVVQMAPSLPSTQTLTEPDTEIRTSQQRTLSKKNKKPNQPSQTETSIVQNELSAHLKQLRQYKDEALLEFQAQFKKEAQETVKQAIAKIFYAKRELMQEVSKVNSAGTSATPSQAENTLFERLERVESQMNTLKSDQSTKAKQLHKESLKSLESYLQKQFQQQQGQLDQLKTQVTLQLHDQSVQQDSRLSKDMISLRKEMMKEINQQFVKFHENKEFFLNHVAKKMSVLDNLVQDYTAKTHDRINDMLAPDSQPHSFTAHSVVSEPQSVQKANTERKVKGDRAEESKAEPAKHQKLNSFEGDAAEKMMDVPVLMGSQSLPIQDRREGNMKFASQGSVTRKSDTDFFNLTEDPSHMLLPEQQQKPEGSSISIQRVINDELENVTPMKVGVVEVPQHKLSKKWQKLANEIIEQLYVDEVIFAMDEVIHLARDQIDVLILNQSKELTSIGRQQLIEQFGQSYNCQSHGESDRYELSISAQDFMPNMSQSIKSSSIESQNSQQPAIQHAQLDDILL